MKDFILIDIHRIRMSEIEYYTVLHMERRHLCAPSYAPGEKGIRINIKLKSKSDLITVEKYSDFTALSESIELLDNTILLKKRVKK